MTTAQTAQLVATVAASAAKATVAHMARTPTTPGTTRKPVATPKPVKQPKRAPLSAAELARKREHLGVCVHEAAHAVAGVVLGAELRNAVVSDGAVTGIQGRAYFHDRPYGRDAEIAYAGPWAQAKFLNGGRRPTQAQMFAMFDGHGSEDYAALTAAGGAHLGQGVTLLVERAWPAVVRVAKQLHGKGEVFEADVLAALGVDDGGGSTSAQLALLRSNMRTVPPLATKQPAPA
ncbi:hypothetical protein [Mycolicibacterium peregrinum]|uniref:hypothetical protein n=1 Tax=Mycolicibacterium peregrinum TaxID=43304 RepID=UPI000DA1AB59|nr:hypothetical protein [Mycolicibacterium peregrinum]